MKPVFRTFLSKHGPLRIRKALIYQGFPFLRILISNFETILPEQLLSLCVKDKIEAEKASFMTVAEVRGLEFDTAISA